MQGARWLVALLMLGGLAMLRAQQDEAPPVTELKSAEPSGAAVTTRIDEAGRGNIVVTAQGVIPKERFLFSAEAVATVTLRADAVEQRIRVETRRIQGEPGTMTLGLAGEGTVRAVAGEGLRSWAVRAEESGRFLDLEWTGNAVRREFVVEVRDDSLELPRRAVMTFLTPGDAAGFRSEIAVEFAEDVEGRITASQGFVEVTDGERRFVFVEGETLEAELRWRGGFSREVELEGTELEGVLAADGKSMTFVLRTRAIVRENGARLPILRGNVAVSGEPGLPWVGLGLRETAEGLTYELSFEREGTYVLEMEFVAGVTPGEEWKGVDFSLGTAGAVVSLRMAGLPAEAEFRNPGAVEAAGGPGEWRGFLPVSGRWEMAWKAGRKAGDGKLFFSSEALVEARAGAGLLRQDHEISLKILQGELETLVLGLEGEGEVLSVEGKDVVGWRVEDSGLKIDFSRPVSGERSLGITSQSTIGALPATAEALRLTPSGSVRHSGLIRLSNEGSVRLEPGDLRGLTQLAPGQFPGSEAEASRQVFVYRFPSADYALGWTATRVEPEITVSQISVYTLTETDRVIEADLEFDIGEAAVREIDVRIPADYALVAATGAQLADYVIGSTVVDGTRMLKLLFAGNIEGRHLVQLRLERNETGAAGDWVLPSLGFPGAKAVRGDIGVAGAPGFRIATGETEQLVEKPLASFPKPVSHLQQAFRLRSRDWSGRFVIEPVPQSIQADLFHLYSLSDRRAYASVLLNYFVTGAPVSEWRVAVPESVENLAVDGNDVRTWRREGESVIIALHQPVLGPYTLLLTFARDLSGEGIVLEPGEVVPLGVQGERGFLQVVSPMQIRAEVVAVSPELLSLDPLELPAEFRLLTSAPPLETWQYTGRPFELGLKTEWFEPGTTVPQVIEFAEVESRVTERGEVVTELVYYVKSRGQRLFRVELPEEMRLWSVAVAGEPVNARVDGSATVIPLPANAAPNVALEVRLRLGSVAEESRRPLLTLPMPMSPVLKTSWRIEGDEGTRVLPLRSNVSMAQVSEERTGFRWLAGRPWWVALGVLIGAGVGIAAGEGKGWERRVGLLAGVLALAGAVVLAVLAARDGGIRSGPLQLSLPALEMDEPVTLRVRSLDEGDIDVSGWGVAAVLAGMATLAWAWGATNGAGPGRIAGTMLVATGLLVQPWGAPWFFGLLAVVMVFVMARPVAEEVRQLREDQQERRRGAGSGKPGSAGEPGGAAGATSVVLLAGGLLMGLGLGVESARAEEEGPFRLPDRLEETWVLGEHRLEASATVEVSGEEGDRFVLLRPPGVLSRFEGAGLQVRREEVPGGGLRYVLEIEAGSGRLQGTFEYVLEVDDAAAGFEVATGMAAIHLVDFQYGKPGWSVDSEAAIRVEAVEGEAGRARLLLAPREAARIRLEPRTRDVSLEATRFFVEGTQLFVPSPGVVDGRHRFAMRPAQGEVRELKVEVPGALTVSGVEGPVRSWRFNAESRELEVMLEPAQAEGFALVVTTQAGLEPLPAETEVKPLRVRGAAGELGLVGLGFGPDAQPETVESGVFTAVPLEDFDVELAAAGPSATLHKVFRYGSGEGAVALRVAPVAPEIRVESEEVISFGDERIVHAVKLEVEIARAGVFQLGFALPEGFEVESLTGGALRDWAETVESESGVTTVVMHLNGKTMGRQQFALTLSGAAPEQAGEWAVPRIVLTEADRQTGQLIVQPATGIRLRGAARRNVSELDPRRAGGTGEGALAFRLLQKDWALTLEIEKLEPWVTAEILHNVTLREGQTRTVLYLNFVVENASVRGIRVRLPIAATALEQMKTVRATGPAVSDMVQVSEADPALWEIQFNRRILGPVEAVIEFERREGRETNVDMVEAAEFPDVNELAYYVSLRSGGRLELETGALGEGWQRIDWVNVPQELRSEAERQAPVETLRVRPGAGGQEVRVRRHALAEALRLRVTEGTITTVLSPRGDQLTEMDLQLEVIQRSSLEVELPDEARLFNIFVNEESVGAVREGGRLRFYVLPGAIENTARVRLTFEAKGPGRGAGSLELVSPRISVPLENMRWRVHVPPGMELLNRDGELELVSEEARGLLDREGYLRFSAENQESRAGEAEEMLQQANRFLQEGEQSRAKRAFSNVARGYALDAASNEDARVQLENLQTQQAVVGLNTRRQRLVLENRIEMPVFSTRDAQILEGAEVNPVLNEGQVEFRPQEMSQLLQGNTQEENAFLERIAGRIVNQQQAGDLAPQAIAVTLPDEGTVYEFVRRVQVEEEAPLELELRLARAGRVGMGRWFILGGALLAVAAAISGTRRDGGDAR